MGLTSVEDGPSRNKAIVAVCIMVGVGIAAGVVGRDSSMHGTTFDPVTAKCDNGGLTSQAKGLIDGGSSPLFGKVSILKAINYRQNPAYGQSAKGFTQHGGMSQKGIQEEMFVDRKHQCAADVITSRGEMTMYYGWKTIDGSVYIEAMAMPNLD